MIYFLDRLTYPSPPRHAISYYKERFGLCQPIFYFLSGNIFYFFLTENSYSPSDEEPGRSPVLRSFIVMKII